jgi:hypothetical protein
MLGSAAAAFARPFELFLIAYALLGPLHYLTEISWLHDKHYYTKGRRDFLFLVAMSVVISVFTLGNLPNVPAWLNTVLIYFSFGSALAFVLTQKTLPRLLFLGGLLATSGAVATNPVLRSTFGILLPTILHVFLFTALFVLVGALKGRSLSGMASLAVFALCAVSFFVLSPHANAYSLSEYVQKSYRGLAGLNYTLMTPFSRHDLNLPENAQQYIRFVNEFLYRSPAAFAVMGFIAFAYTYHYLNWFSKTSIIQWHNIPRRRFVGVIAIWLASVAIYVYSYRLGLKWLFFLSFSHVLLEFPLNHITFISIGREIRQALVPGSVLQPIPVGPARGRGKSDGGRRRRSKRG